MRQPYVTGGYDIAVQVSEAEYNHQLATLFAAGSEQFPGQIRRPFDVGLAAGQVNFLFDTPWLGFERSPQHRSEVARYEYGVPDVDLTVDAPEQITLCLPFSEAFVDFEGGWDLQNLDGNILVQEAVTVRTPEDDQSVREVGLGFDDGIGRIEVGFTPETVARLDAVMPRLDALLRGVIQSEVETLLEDDVQWIPLSPEPVTVADDDDPMTPADVEATLLRTGGDALAFLIPTQGDTTGDASTITAPNTTAGTPVVVLVDGDTLLGDIVCPSLADAVEAPDDAFEAPCRLRIPVPMDVSSEEELDRLIVTSLEGRLREGYIEVTGAFEGDGFAEGIPFEVDGDFRIQVFLDLEDGAISVRVEMDDPNVNVDFPWYVQFTTVAIGVLTGGIGGAVVAGLVLVIADAIADSVAKGIAKGVFADQLADVENLNIPLGPAAAGFELIELELTPDALALGGRPTRADEMPLAARADRLQLAPGQAIDLDTGEVRSAVFEGADCSWRYGPNGPGIYAASGAIMATLAEPYDPLTVVDVEQAEYESDAHRQHVPAAVVPQRIRILGIEVGTKLTLAVQTSENRYAKCECYQRNGRLYLTYVTYDRPTPQVVIDEVSEVTETNQIESGTDSWPSVSCFPAFSFEGRQAGGGVEVESRSAEYTVDEVAYRITATAHTRLLAFPLRGFEWSLDDTPIDGQGTLHVDGHPVAYDVSDGRCTLETELGDGLTDYLRVAVTDDRGLTVSDRNWLSYPPTVKRGGLPPGAIREANDEIARCLRGPIDRFPPNGPGGIGDPGGVRPDPVPPWALDELTQPGLLGGLLDSDPKVLDELVTGLLTPDTAGSGSLRERAVSPIETVGGRVAGTTGRDDADRSLRVAIEQGMDLDLRRFG
jgi:hypothetical protein